MSSNIPNMRACMALSKALEVYLASRFPATTGTDHGALHGAAPPSVAGAGLVVNNRQASLLQLSRQLTSSWGQQAKLII